MDDSARQIVKNLSTTALLLVLILISTVGSWPPCEEDYAPCQCEVYQNEEVTQKWVYCFSVNVTDIKEVFRKTPTVDFEAVNLFLSPSDPAEEIPADLMADSRALDIVIFGSSTSEKPLRINRNAFRSSRTLNKQFEIDYNDLTGTDMGFLEGFDNLRDLIFMEAVNLPSALATLPPLPGISRLFIDRCYGLNNTEWSSQVPPLSKGLDVLFTQYLMLDDQETATLLDWVLLSSEDSLSELVIDGENVTEIPSEVTSFNHLDNLQIFGNKAPLVITSGSLSFSTPPHWVELGYSNIVGIEPGAFQGDFGQAEVNLNDNYLTRFEAEVFQAILQQMLNKPGSAGHLIGDGNPFDCTDDLCHLAWLIRDNRKLLDVVSEGTACSNGTRFHDLDPDGFNDTCLVTSTTTETTTVSTSISTTPSAASKPDPLKVFAHLFLITGTSLVLHIFT